MIYIQSNSYPMSATAHSGIQVTKQTKTEVSVGEPIAGCSDLQSHSTHSPSSRHTTMYDSNQKDSFDDLTCARAAQPNFGSSDTGLMLDMRGEKAA